MANKTERRVLPSADRFYGTRAFAVFCLIILATVLMLSTWSDTEAGENDPPPKPAPSEHHIISV